LDINGELPGMLKRLVHVIHPPFAKMTKMAWAQFVGGAIHELSLPSGPSRLNRAPTSSRVDIRVPIGEGKMGVRRLVDTPRFGL